MHVDLLIHQRLRDCRRVLLIVAKAAVADDIEHHVAVETEAALHRDLRRERHGFRLIAVHMQHRGFRHLRGVRAVEHGALVAGIRRRKTDLVIDHDVNRAAGPKASGGGEVQRFLHDALARERGVAVNENAKHLVTFAVTELILTRPDRAERHRIRGFEVRGVELHRHPDRARGGRDRVLKTVVILHVA